ncbi:MAG: stalk domain-containing protein [Lachnospirales bacterium]
MKRLLILTMAVTTMMTTVAYANSPTKPVTESNVEIMLPIYDLTAEQTEAEVPLIAIDRETLEEIVGARDYAEGIGYEVLWNDSLKQITFTKGSNVFTATINSNVYTKNGEEVVLETKTSLINGKAYIPTSFKKMLLDIPVVEPEPITNVEPITPTLPVVDTDTDDTDVTPVGVEVEAILEPEIAMAIADEIEGQLDTFKEEQLKANEEYKDAFLSTGGTLEEYLEPTYEIDYEILSLNENYVSVKVYRYTSLASAFTEEVYSTYNSKTGEKVSLEYFVGEGYEEYVKEKVLEIAEYNEKVSPEEYNYDEKALENLEINEDTSFYLDDEQNIVVVFDKYEVADGSKGVQEFIIPIIKILN